MTTSWILQIENLQIGESIVDYNLSLKSHLPNIQIIKVTDGEDQRTERKYPKHKKVPTSRPTSDLKKNTRSNLSNGLNR